MSNANEKKRFRHEQKYLISAGEKELICRRIAPLLQVDRHAQGGRYKIRSLYFEDYWNNSYEEKLMGVYGRRKYRIRLYNDSDEVIRLECKSKQGSYIHKESAPLSRQETDQLLAGDYGFLLRREERLCRQFYYECTVRLMRPRVIVDYEREPYVLQAGDVRVTFDTDVRTALLGYDLFDATLPVLYLLEPGKLVMEVKFTEFMPTMVKEAVPPRAAEWTAVSKYVLACEKTGYLVAQTTE